MALNEKDKDIIRRIIGGDRASFDYFVSIYLQKVYNYVLVRVSDRRRAEVLTETILTEAVHAFDRYDGSMSLDGWIFQITEEVLQFQKAPLRAALLKTSKSSLLRFSYS